MKSPQSVTQGLSVTVGWLGLVSPSLLFLGRRAWDQSQVAKSWWFFMMIMKQHLDMKLFTTYMVSSLQLLFLPLKQRKHFPPLEHFPEHNMKSSAGMSSSFRWIYSRHVFWLIVVIISDLILLVSFFVSVTVILYQWLRVWHRIQTLLCVDSCRNFSLEYIPGDLWEYWGHSLSFLSEIQQ